MFQPHLANATTILPSVLGEVETAAAAAGLPRPFFVGGGILITSADQKVGAVVFPQADGHWTLMAFELTFGKDYEMGAGHWHKTAADAAWLAHLQAALPHISAILKAEVVRIVGGEIHAHGAEFGDASWSYVLRIGRAGVKFTIGNQKYDEFQDLNDGDGDQERLRRAIDYALTKPHVYVSDALMRILTALTAREAAAWAATEHWVGQHASPVSAADEAQTFAERIDRDFDLIVGTGAGYMATAIGRIRDDGLACRLLAAHRGPNVFKDELA